MKKHWEAEIVPGRTIVCDIDSERKDNLIIIDIKEKLNQKIHFSFPEILQLMNFLKTIVSKGGGII